MCWMWMYLCHVSMNISWCWVSSSSHIGSAVPFEIPKFPRSRLVKALKWLKSIQLWTSQFHYEIFTSAESNFSFRCLKLYRTGSQKESASSLEIFSQIFCIFEMKNFFLYICNDFFHSKQKKPFSRDSFVLPACTDLWMDFSRVAWESLCDLLFSCKKKNLRKNSEIFLIPNEN